MKKYGISFLLLLLISNSYANTLYQQLCEFNPNWSKYEKLVPEEEAIEFRSDQAYIKEHLKQVLSILNGNSIAHLSNNQNYNRKKLIALLTHYRKEGRFPKNHYRKDRIPVFIDEHETHCAVGYLLQQTGYEEIAQRIAQKNNYAWVKEINDQGLGHWQNASGFSIEELKLIQGAYDSYMLNALFHPNKYEIPQKPECMTIYFDDNAYEGGKINKRQNFWCYGEGKDSILNGAWIQNYSVDLPWILGYFENGNRTGQWKEYYQGTNQLCRTENWRNDKLNGVRTRYDRAGVIIEEILFKNGEVVTKTNYDLRGGLKWIRRPIDSTIVNTEVFTLGGAMIASGKESIYNPGNLEWFQNIELTALNTFAVTSRDGAPTASNDFQGGFNGTVFNTKPLVQYKKEGNWIFYREFNPPNQENEKIKFALKDGFNHFGEELHNQISFYKELKQNFDSLNIHFDDNYITDFKGFGKEEKIHLKINYHAYQIIPFFNIDFYYGRAEKQAAPISKRPIKSIGAYNKDYAKIGLWKYFGSDEKLEKTELFIVPWKEPLNENLNAANAKPLATKEVGRRSNTK